MQITVIGLTITSSWGNGHATTFRSLLKGLHRRGHDVLFLERDVAYYASQRDMPDPPFCRVGLYDSVQELKARYHHEVATADLVVVGSYVPDGIAVGHWATTVATGPCAFYDIDTPVTMARLRNDDCDYLTPALIPRYDMYLSFAGGPVLDYIVDTYHSPSVRPLYCSVDPDLYFPQEAPKKWDIGYLGTYSPDRQPPLEELLLTPSRRCAEKQFVVAGPLYPASIDWPRNVTRIEHLPPAEHRAFYNEQAFTLNITRQDMVKFGYSPSVRLFEAAACGTPVISDRWQGMEAFFKPGEEILLVSQSEEVLDILNNCGEAERKAIGARARKKVLARHDSNARAAELETYCREMKCETL